MQTIRLNTACVMLLLLAFISQAMASSTMSYHMMSNEPLEQHLTKLDASVASMQHHSQQEMVAQVATDNDKHHNSCCSTNKTCLVLCSIATTLTSEVILQQPITVSTVKYSSITEVVISQQPKSLYRPPISS